VAEATSEKDAAFAAVEAANAAVEAAQRELAGAETGDGRDKSNRSLQERLSDAENGQVPQPTQTRKRA
jgi:structural maintenance of chromosome 2